MKTQHDVLMEDPEFRKLFSVESLVTRASELIATLMVEQGVSKADLARRLNKSRAWVTQLLSGQANMTVRTLAEVVHALGGEVALQSQAPRWKGAATPRQSDSKPFVYRVVYPGDNYSLDQPRTVDEVFRLESSTMKPASEEIAPESEGPVRPGYAA